MLFLDFRGQVTVVEMVDSSFELLSPLPHGLETEESHECGERPVKGLKGGGDPHGLETLLNRYAPPCTAALCRPPP